MTTAAVAFNGTTYSEASIHGHAVAGLIHKELPAGQQRRPAWLSFIAVHDVDAEKTIALQQGGTIARCTAWRQPMPPSQGVG